MTNVRIIQYQTENQADFGHDLSIYLDGSIYAQSVDGIAETERCKRDGLNIGKVYELAGRLWKATEELEHRPLVMCIDYKGQKRGEGFEDNIIPEELKKLKGKTIIVDPFRRVIPIPYSDRLDKLLSGSVKDLGEWFYDRFHKIEMDIGYEVRIYADGCIEVKIKDEVVEVERSKWVTAESEKVYMARELREKMWWDINMAMNQFLLSRGGFSQTLISVANNAQRKDIGYNDEAPTEQLITLDKELSDICIKATENVEAEKFYPFGKPNNE